MSITHGYCTLAEVKAAAGIPLDSDRNDTLLELAVEAASRQIDAHCGRRFWQDSTVVQRFYFPTDRRVLSVDDISTLTGLLVDVDDGDNGTFSLSLTRGTDFAVHPVNAAAEYPVRPWTSIQLLDGNVTGYVTSSSGRPYVRVTAKFGWSAVPEPVNRACVLQAKNIYKAPDMAGGSYQLADDGTQLFIVPLDKMAQALLEQFKRWHEADDG
jgi:hypothetical protein